ncbi:MAG TPA: hypothetical protein VMD92_13195, partial [Acidobacteriaceae bacterium]|nr:hypothetical protein [Acidobacteriaceae bacterium]
MSTLGYQKHCKSLKKSVGNVPTPSPAPSPTSAFWLQTSAFVGKNGPVPLLGRGDAAMFPDSRQRSKIE